MANTYNLHNFTSGMKLSSAAMKDIDEQIKENANNIDTLTDRMDAVQYERQQEIRSLTLTTDGQSVMLYYHDQLLGEITLPGDLESIIKCTALSVPSNEIEIIVGQTPVTITATRQPADCNQHLKFMSGDVQKAVVTSAGAVSGLAVGKVPITVKCGTFTQTVMANIKKNVSLAGNVSLISWLMVTDEGWTTPAVSGQQNTSVQYQYNAELTYLGNAPYDLSKYVLHPNEKLNIVVQNPLSIRRMWIVKRKYSNVDPYIVNTIEDNDIYFLTPVAIVQEIGGSTSTKTMEYNNYLTQDVWVVLFLNQGSETIEQNIDDYVSWTVSVADEQQQP